MKKIVRWLFKFLLFLIAIPLLYIVVSLVLSIIPVNTDSKKPNDQHTIYLSTNGVHLDIVLPLELMDEQLLDGLNKTLTDKFFGIGWGEENFYLNTPQWSDLSFNTAVNAAFLDNTTLLHITRHNVSRSDWVKVELSDDELEKLNLYILNTFQLDAAGDKIFMADAGYSTQDDFYKARGSYSFHHTCNSWVNSCFRESGLKAALWTPFDFGVMNKYE